MKGIGPCYQKENNDDSIPFKIKLGEHSFDRENKETHFKNNRSMTKGIDAAVQTDLALKDEQIQTYQLEKKAHLYTQNIDLIEQIQVQQSPKRKGKSKDKNIMKVIEKKQHKIEENNLLDPFLIKYKYKKVHKTNQKKNTKLQDKLVFVLNQTQLNKSSKPTKVPSNRMDIQINLSKCVCQGEINQEEYYKCEICSNCFHYSCHRRQKTNSTTEVCPFCILREIEITQQIEEILCEQYLELEKGTTLFKGEFNFKPYEYYCSQKLRNHQLEIRCIQVQGNSQTMTEVTWPNECKFFLDGHKIFQAMWSRKRKDFPLKFGDYIYQEQIKIDLQKVQLKLKSNQSKIIQIDDNFEIKKPIYLLGIYFTKGSSFSAATAKMLSRLKTSNNQYMQNLIDNDNHQGLQVSKLIYSLLDPYSWNVIRLPVRGVHCRHAQCFDMGTYLSLLFADSTRYFKCPLCMKSTLILSKDHQQQAILQNIKNSERLPKEIVYYKSGIIEVYLYKQEEDSEQQGRKVTRVVRRSRRRQHIKQQEIDVKIQQQKPM